jgi:hypothetical protein
MRVRRFKFAQRETFTEDWESGRHTNSAHMKTNLNGGEAVRVERVVRNV